MRLRLHGILPAMVTPMHPDQSIDEKSLRRFAQHLLDQGAHALVVHADSGEGNHLDPDERVEVMRIVASEAKGKVPLIAGLIASHTREAQRLARQAADAGADCLMVFPITACRGRPLPPEVPVRYHQAVADASGLPLILFLLQDALGGIEYEPAVLRRLLEIDQVTAIKHATFDAKSYVATRQIVRSVNREIDYLSGNDNFIYESFLLGGDGCLIGFGSVATKLQVDMYDAWRRGDLKAAEAHYHAFEPLCDAIFEQPIRDYRARMKEVLAMQGIIADTTVREPLLPIPDADRQRLRLAAKAVGLL